MPDDGVIQLRRNPNNKQSSSRPHLSRYGKNKGSSTRLAKYNTNSRSALALHKAQNGSSQSLTNYNNTNQAPTNQTNNQPANVDASNSNANAAGGAPNGGSHRITKRAANYNGGSVLGPHRYRGLSSGLGNLAQSHRKPVIQLEREEEEEDEDENDPNNSGSAEFEDLDDEDDDDFSDNPNFATLSDTRLNIGIQPVEPTPPKLSDETVISVSSFADMASALKGVRDKSGFVNDADLISTAVNRSKNLGSMSEMVHGWNASSRGSIGGTTSNLSNSTSNIRRNNSNIPGEDDPREFEKVFREYTNTRAVMNPVISSLCRISAAQSKSGVDIGDQSTSSSLYNFSTDVNGSRSDLVNGGSGNGTYGSSSNGGLGGRNNASRLQLPAVKKVNSLVATTAHQMSDYSERGNVLVPEGCPPLPQNHRAAAGGGVPTYILNKIWQSGWVDPEAPSSSARLPEGIQDQAIRIQSKLSKAKDRNAPQSRGSSIRITQ